MADILGIGASGLAAYRKSLEVTGNNIVNANTEGYARRSATLNTVGERAATPTSLTATGGGGVLVDVVKRASDSFLQARMWTSVSASNRAEALADGIGRLEKGLLTTPSNINTAVDDFFGRLQDLASSPTSMPARYSVVDAADQVVTQFRVQDSVVASEIDSAKSGVSAGLDQANVLTAQIARLNGDLARGGSRPSNDLLDQRDKLLGELSALVGVTVREQSTGAVDVFLGQTTSGPQLVTGNRSSILGIATVGERIEIVVDPYGSNTATNELTGGAVAGALEYHRQALVVRDDINRLAVAFADMMNAQHREGVDLAGAPGGAMFSTESLAGKAGSGNRGSAEIVVDLSAAGALVNREYTATFDADSDLWTVTSANVSVSGRTSVTIDGIRMEFTGKAEDRDTFTVSPLDKAAQGIRLLIDDPAKLAAALPRYADASTSNTGTAEVQIETARAATPPPALPQIQEVLSQSLSPSGALGLARNGVVATIPSGASAVNLASLRSLSAAAFVIGEKEIVAQTTSQITLRVEPETAAVTLDFTLRDGSAASFAAGINDALASAGYDGDLFASSAAGILTINALGTAKLAEFSIAGITRSTSPLEAPADAADLMIFTREGRQLSGPELSIADRAALLTEANGFTADAVYMTPSQTAGYRGMSFVESSSPLAVSLGSDGVRRVTVSAFPETDSVQRDGAGLPLAGAVYALDVSGMPAVRLAGDAVAGLGSEAVAAKLQAALDSSATMRTVSGAAFTLPATSAETDIRSFTVSVGGVVHEVRFERAKTPDEKAADGSVIKGTFLQSGTFTVVDGTDLRFELSNDGANGLAVNLFMPKHLAADGGPSVTFSGADAADLGLTGTLTVTLSAAGAADPNAVAAGRDVAINLGGSIETIDLTGRSGSYTSSTSGATVTWSTDADGKMRLRSTDTSMRIVARTAAERTAAADLGFRGADLTVERVGAELRITSTVTDATQTKVDASKSVSRVGGAVTMTGAAPEDLLVLMRSDGTKRDIVGRFPADIRRVDPEAPDFDVTVISGDRVEIFDRATGVSLAHRSFKDGEPIEYQGVRFRLSGVPQTGDTFAVVKDTTRTGDSRNALLLAGLRLKDAFGPNSGSFQDAYLAAAAKIGSSGQVANLAATSAARAASDLKASYEGKTGVNLDDEAADLIRFQQAYQAAAQVVMAAREMFSTILKTF